MTELLTAADVERMARDAGISVGELCRRAQIAPTTLSRWRAGKTQPQMRVYQRIVDALRATDGEDAA